MSEFKPLFSTPEVGTFKPAPSTKQYAVEQAASRNPEHTSEFESIRRPESESSSPPIPTEDQSHDAQDDAGEHELPAEPDVDSHDPMLLPEAVEDMLEQARLEGIEEGRRQAEDQLAEAQGMLEHLNNGLSQLDDLHRQTLRATAADIGAETIAWLGLIYGPIVSGFALVCVYCYSKYGLNRQRHADIVAELAVLRAERAQPASKRSSS